MAIAELRPSNASGQRKFKMKDIRADRLLVDHNYQRELVPARVRSIVNDFDFDALGVLIVSYRDGRYYVIDGQHRHAALMELGLGEWEVTCKVYEGLTDSDEAAIFVEANNTRKPSAYDIFKASLRARDPECVGVTAIVERNGLEIAAYGRDGTVTCVTTLRQIYRAAPFGVLLDKTLGVAVDAFGVRSVAVEGHVLAGISIVLKTYEDKIDRPTLVQKLSKAPGGASGLVGRARTLREMRSASLDRLVAAVIVAEYNKGRRSGMLADL